MPLPGQSLCWKFADGNFARRPEADFYAPQTVAEKFISLQLFDMSRDGATDWTWTSFPMGFFDDYHAQNPKIYFMMPGMYDICLTVKNDSGSHTLCKKQYLTMLTNNALCADVKSTESAGRITDDGGMNGNYGSNRNCTFLIDPRCSKDSISLSVTRFMLNDAGDMLKVYDGGDATGRLLGVFNGNTSLNSIHELKAGSGRMFIEWITDATGDSSGFEAIWRALPDTATSLTADFNFRISFIPARK